MRTMVVAGKIGPAFRTDVTYRSGMGLTEMSVTYFGEIDVLGPIGEVESWYLPTPRPVPAEMVIIERDHYIETGKNFWQ